jgi:hypothetical protein
MRQTRHKSTEVALGHLRPADLWCNNVTEGMFSVRGRPHGMTVAARSGGIAAVPTGGTACFRMASVA